MRSNALVRIHGLIAARRKRRAEIEAPALDSWLEQRRRDRLELHGKMEWRISHWTRRYGKRPRTTPKHGC